MATKKEVMEQAARGEGCLGRAADYEPVFVLRAQDMTSISTLCHWVILCAAGGAESAAKVAQAKEVIKEFREWQRLNSDRVRMPT